MQWPRKPSCTFGRRLYVDDPGIGPVGAMWTNIILGLASTVIFTVFVKDPRYEKKAEAATAEEEEEDEGKDDETPPL